MSNVNVSFEFFPPKTPELEEVLWQNVEKLAPFDPRFISVTYGAGGSTRARTHAIVQKLLDEEFARPAAHLTCVGAPKSEIDEIIRTYWENGVRHIVALRGDPPGGPGTPYVSHPEGYDYTSDLVAAIKAIAPFHVCVGAYPEKHPESASLDDDIDALQAKVDAGADCAITQFFFHNDVYFRFVDKVRARGIDIPIIPGILPVQNFKQAARFAHRCGTHIPEKILNRFEGLEDDPQTRSLVAAAVCAEQVEKLRENGITDFHFYTLNHADLSYAVCHLLGLRPRLLTEAA
ncbi:MAG: methylenetetrahydrofolate reductase [NAD(P)H] [Pseudomonadota bacterium]